jgi:hypothetical protein
MISQRLWMVECMDLNYLKRKWNSDGLLANCCYFETRRNCCGFKTDFTLIISALRHSHVYNNITFFAAKSISRLLPFSIRYFKPTCRILKN